MTFPFASLRVFAKFFFILIVFTTTSGAESTAGDGYSVLHGWPELPVGRTLGQATGVAVDSHNHVFVFHRAGNGPVDPALGKIIEASTVIAFDGDTGEMVAEWGGNMFVRPHGLSVDAEDNVWLTDVARHQVFKLSHDGELLLIVGENGVAGDDRTHFSLPSGVAVLEDGSFFVSDGYGNSRIVKFSSDGEFQYQWGEKGSGEGQFDLPHAIAIDGESRVYVSDRRNSRVQVFDLEGRFLAQWKSSEIGRPYAVAFTPHDKAFVVDGGDQPAEPPDRSRAMRVSLNGEVEATFGRYGNYDGQFQMAHDVAVGEDGAIYVVDIFGMRVQKFMPN